MLHWKVLHFLPFYIVNILIETQHILSYLQTPSGVLQIILKKMNTVIDILKV